VRKLAIALSLIVGYVLVSSLFAYVLFPEAGPYPSDLPPRGTVVLNPPIKSRFVFRRTAIETEGKIVEWDNFVEPGGGPINIPHLHPWMRESFDVIDGEITFVVDGKERVVKAGSRIVIAPGSTHAFQNVTNRPANMITRLEAATEGPWKELANEGRLGDSAFVQFGRVGGMGAASPIQMLVFGRRFNYVARMAGMPIWLQDTLSFLIPPTARLFGIHSYYPPNESTKHIPS
jgi:mannose-6-phosphate isomerase-like protein (cupin superfamily)